MSLRAVGLNLPSPGKISLKVALIIFRYVIIHLRLEVSLS